jgi:hypothetical protein
VAAGWRLKTGDPRQVMFNRPRRGLIIAVGPQNGRIAGAHIPLERLPVPAMALVRVFRKHGFAFTLDIDSDVTDANAAILIVGYQP